MSVAEMIRAGGEPLVRRVEELESEIGARATPRVRRDLSFLAWTDEEWAAREGRVLRGPGDAGLALDARGRDRPQASWAQPMDDGG